MFAVGILATIAVTGAITAALGRIMGDVGPYGKYAVAAIFFGVGLYLMDLIRLPETGVALRPLQRCSPYTSALVLGLVFGIAHGPCTFAFMAPVLGVVATLTADPVGRPTGTLLLVPGLTGSKEGFLALLPLLAEAVRQARRRGLGAGIVTNAYWATADSDAELWLRPLRRLGVTDVALSDDALHYGDSAGARARIVEGAARRLGMNASVMCTEGPRLADTPDGPVVRGDVMFRGRAAAKLTAGLPTRPWDRFTRCTRENLADPKRVHVDTFGHLHLCQGHSRKDSDI